MGQEDTREFGHGVRPSGIESADPGRRRLIRGAGAGAGVLLAVPARTALGGTCQSPSVAMSGQHSQPPNSGSTCSGGLSPGYWVQPQHSPTWSFVPATFPQINGQLVTCDTTSLQKVQFSDITNQGTTLQSIFPAWQPIPSSIGSVSMWWVIESPNDAIFGGPGGIGQLLRALSCAWLTAGYFKTSAAQFPVPQSQVIDMWKQLSTTGSYCPPSLLGCGNPWSPSQVISYFEGMYDVNAPVPNYCKQ
jgi:hypothetical protein